MVGAGAEPQRAAGLRPGLLQQPPGAGGCLKSDPKPPWFGEGSPARVCKSTLSCQRRAGALGVLLGLIRKYLGNAVMKRVWVTNPTGWFGFGARCLMHELWPGTLAEGDLWSPPSLGWGLGLGQQPWTHFAVTSLAGPGGENATLGLQITVVLETGKGNTAGRSGQRWRGALGSGCIRL